MNLTLGGGGHRGSSSPPASRPAPSKPAAPPPSKPAAPPPSKPAAPPPSKPATTKSTPQTPSKPTVASSTGTARTSYVKPSGNSTPTAAQQNGHGSQDYLLDKAFQKQQSSPPKKTETKQPTPPVVVKPPVKTGNSTPTVAQQNGYGSQDHMLDKATQGQQSPPRKKAETIESGPAKKSTVEPVVVTSLLPEIVRNFYTSATKAIEKAETEKGESLGAVIKKKTIEETKATQGRGDLSQNRDEVEKKGTQQTLGKANQTQIKFIEGRGNQDFQLSKEHAQLKLEENRLNRIISKSKLGKGELSLNIENNLYQASKKNQKMKLLAKDALEKANKANEIHYDYESWESELKNNISKSIEKISQNIPEDKKKELVQQIVIDEAQSLQEKYWTLYYASGTMTLNSVKTHAILDPLFTEFPMKRDDETNPMVEDIIKWIGFGGSLGLNTGVDMWGNSVSDINKAGIQVLNSEKNLVNKVDDVAKQVENVVEGGSTLIRSANPNEIRFSQSSVNGLDEIVASMKKNGWVGDPIDVVRMSDGKLTTIDNTRVLAAREAGIDVKMIVHEADEALPSNFVDRFTTKKGVPTTWEEAVQLRIQKQNSSFRNANPNGAYEMK